MEPDQIVSALRRHAPLALAHIVLGAIIGLAVALLSPPVYSSHTKALVAADGGGGTHSVSSASSVITNIMPTLVEIGTSQSVVDRVSSSTGVDRSKVAGAVKLEGGTRQAPAIEAIVKAGIPVVGHVGFTPQSENALGGPRVQQDTTGHRGRKGDPLYQIRNLLRASRHRLTPRQQERLREAFVADEAHISVEVAYHCAQQVRDVFHQATPAQGRRLAAHLIQRLPRCPIPEIARLGRTLRKWKDALDAYFDTAGASNAPHRSHQQTLSSWADAPPEATATPPTTNSECSSSQEA